MVKDDLERRVEESGVRFDTLSIAVNCGAYESIEEVLDTLDEEWPLGDAPRDIIARSRMMLINEDIDRMLFQTARKITAWTWLEDYGLVFILIGPESRGIVLQEKLAKAINFTLKYHRRGGEVRFLRFFGDSVRERKTRDGRPIFSQFQLLSGKLKSSTKDTRYMLESLVRTCDDPIWHHTAFPFIHTEQQLDPPHKLLRQHDMLTHDTQ